MDWQMVGALGELLGAIGVIITLAYLAVQIRQGRLASLQRAAGEIQEESASFLGLIAGQTEIARLFRRGLAAEQDMSPDERVQFGALILQLMDIWERLYHLSRSGHAEPWIEHQMVHRRRDIIGSPGFQLWFGERKHWISPDFRRVLEEEMGTAPEYRPPVLGSGEVPDSVPDDQGDPD